MVPLLSTLESGHPFLASAMGGALIGSLIGGLASALAAYAFSKRMFRNRILDHARLELKGPLGAYTDWLNAVSAGFASWKTEILPCFLAHSPEDQFELNRMRKLFVDERNAQWLSRLEEFDSILPKFAGAIKSMWIRQTEIGFCFDKVFANLESDPPEAVKWGEHAETLAFEQSQLVSDFLYQIQYECLRTVALRKPRSPKDLVKPRIVRSAFGRVHMVSPKVSQS